MEKQPLRTKLLYENMTYKELAREKGVTPGKVEVWALEHGIHDECEANGCAQDSIENRRNYGGSGGRIKQYEVPEDELREKFLVNRMSKREIAKEYGCSETVISDRLNEYGIKALHRPPNVSTYGSGYVYCWDNDREIAIHRLLAISEYGFEAVCENDVHHKNRIRWDNRPDNIEVVSRSEHMTIHAEEDHHHEGGDYRDKEWLYEQYKEKDKSCRQIAKECGVSDQTIINWRNRLGIEKKKKKHRDEEWLTEKIVEEELRYEEISNMCNARAKTIATAASYFDLTEQYREMHDVYESLRGKQTDDCEPQDPLAF